MILIAQYFGSKPHTETHWRAAMDLLSIVNRLIVEFQTMYGFHADDIDPDTGTQISGSRGGNGDGGFRLPTATTGKGLSSHKEARGIDIYDPHNLLDNWLTDAILEQYGLYREHPDSTPGWCHLTTRAPGSGLRTFQP